MAFNQNIKHGRDSFSTKTNLDLHFACLSPTTTSTMGEHLPSVCLALLICHML